MQYTGEELKKETTEDSIDESVTEPSTDVDQEYQPADREQAAATGKAQENRSRQPLNGWERFKQSRLFGTFVYVYFAAFVAVHVIALIALLIRALNPILGFSVWVVSMIVATISVLALTVWRDTLRTYWSDQ